MLEILIIDALSRLHFVCQNGVSVWTMTQVGREDLDTIVKMSPNLVFLANRFPGYAVHGSCLQGLQILHLLQKYLPNVPVVGLGQWPSGMDIYDLSGIESQERFQELFGGFLAEK